MNSSSMMLNTLLLPSMLLGTEPNFMIHLPPPDSMTSVVYLYAHGLGATQQQAQALLPHNKHWILNRPLAAFDFPDSKPAYMEYDPKHVNLGQQADIDRLRYAYWRTRQELPDYMMVIGAVSRGAVTAFNCMALHQLEYVKALVLESPFDTFANVVKHLLRRFHIGWIPFSRKLAIRYVKKTFPSFDINGVFPLTVAHMIPHDLPIIIIHGKRDKTIPIKSSRLIYCALLENGHKDVYLLELDEGDHGKLIAGPNGEIYQNVVHAFYRRYDLPHDPLLAQRGEAILNQCQPSLDSMKRYVKKLKKIRKKMKRDLLEAAEEA
jgi:pimeloyl-ACP methyl ester carboxylesterase